MFLSSDNGNTWTAVNNGLTCNYVGAVISNGTNIIAGTAGAANNGIFLSTNNGTSWTSYSTGMMEVGALIAINDTMVLASVGSAVYRSTNNGSSWSKIDSNLDDIDAFALSGSNIFAGTRGSKVIRSTDNGSTWGDASSGLPGFGQLSSVAVCGTDILAGVYTEGVYRSTDNGGSWTSASTGLTNLDMRALQVVGSSIFAATEGGVFLSTDNGTSWSAVRSGLTDTLVYSLASNGTNLFAGTFGPVYRLPLSYFSPLSAPVLSFPADGSVNQALAPVLRWAEDTAAFSYHIQLAQDSTFATIVYDDSTIKADSVHVGILSKNTSYFWRLKSLNLAGSSDWSVSRRFTTHDVLPVGLVSPANNSINQPLSLTLSWSTPAYFSTYRLQVAMDSSFSSPVFDDSTITGAAKQLGLVASDTDYFWRVMVIDSGSRSPWSPTWRFKTLILAPSIVNISPGDNEITLSWSASSSPGVIKYKLYRGTSSPASTLVDSTIATSYVDSGLTNGTRYFYRITSENSHYVEGPPSSEVNSIPFNQPPHAARLSNVLLLSSGRSAFAHLTFSSQGSVDSDGTIDSTLWFVNNQRTATGPSLAYDFGPGTTRVTLVVIDNQNAMDSSVAFVNRAAYVRTLGGQVTSGLSMVGGNVLYASASGDAVYRLDSNENVVYKLQVAGSIGSSCSIAYDSTVYIPSSDNNLYAFSKNATSVWSALPLGGNTSATPAVDSTLQRVYIGVSNNNFIGVDRLTGNVVWNFFTSSPISNCAVISSDRRLVFPTNDGTVYGVDLEASNAPTAPSWMLSLTDPSPTSPAIDQYGYFYFGTAGGNLYAVSMKRGEQASQRWNLHLGGHLVAAPVIDANGILYIGSTDSTLYAVNITSKSVVWRFKTGGSIRYTAAISPAGTIYFDNDAGQLYCLDNLGNALWSFDDSPDSLQAIGTILYNDGMVYAGAGAKSIIAIYDGSGTQSGAYRVSNAGIPIWGTFQGNNQRTGLQTISIISSTSNPKDKLPTSYALYANYPNPFNPSTIISYDTPKLTHVTLIVYDVLGRQVELLVNGEKMPGRYQASFDAGALPSGVYFYRFQAGAYHDTKKLLLLK